MEQLRELAGLLAERNAVDARIGAIIGRPAHIGHIGEYLAAAIFDLALHTSAVHPGSDGHFRSGPLSGRSVNVKWYAKLEGLLDINPLHLADYSLVLTGPRQAAASSRGLLRPVALHAVYLFDLPVLVDDLRRRSLKMGVATSVRCGLWDQAEVYPASGNPTLPLTSEQRAVLAMFADPLA